MLTARAVSVLLDTSHSFVALACTLTAVSGQIHIRRDGHIGQIILDQPERRNAISANMWRELADGADELASDHDIKVVVMRGAGEIAFAAGADISQFAENRSNADRNNSYYDATNAAHKALSGMNKPLIAAIHGFCIGGGLAVALNADIRVAADDAQFAIPAARLGLGYEHSGIGTLVSLVGPSAAKRIFFMASRFDAEEALQMGLVNRVVPKVDLDSAVADWADRIAQNAPMTIAAAKAAVRQLSRPDRDRDFTEVDAMIRACYESEDYREGVDAFLNKRQAQFKGK